jgi:hypothetical protein
MASPIPTGMSIRDDIRRRIIELENPPQRRAPTPPGTPQAPSDPGPAAPGRTGFMPQELRQSVREGVESLSPVSQFIAESSIATLGTMFGSLFGLPGAVVGGTAGEAISQELGVSPMSDANLGLSAGGPVVGKGLGLGLRRGKRLAGKAITNVSFAKAAISRNIMRRSVQEMSSTAANILAKQKGLMQVSSDKLFNAIDTVAGKVDFRRFASTNVLFGRFRKEVAKLPPTPEGKTLLKTIEGFRHALRSSGQQVSYRYLTAIRKIVGTQVADVEKVIGGRLTGFERLKDALLKDLELLAAKGGKVPGGKGASIVVSATKRAKLEFAVRELEEATARFSTPIKGRVGASEVDVNKLRSWLIDITNPKSGTFNKSFTDALKDDIPTITKRLAELSANVSPGGAGGPGSLIIRASTARLGRSVVGGLVGYGALGPFGAAVGSVAGASIPEMLTAMLMTRGGAAILSTAAKAGKGEINAKSWMLAGQAISQSAQGKSSERLDRSL